LKWAQDPVKVLEEEEPQVAKDNRSPLPKKMNLDPLIMAAVELQTRDQQHKIGFSDHP